VKADLITKNGLAYYPEKQINTMTEADVEKYSRRPRYSGLYRTSREVTDKGEEDQLGAHFWADGCSP